MKPKKERYCQRLLLLVYQWHSELQLEVSCFHWKKSAIISHLRRYGGRFSALWSQPLSYSPSILLATNIPYSFTSNIINHVSICNICIFYTAGLPPVHSGPENLKKSSSKKLVKSNKSILRKNFFDQIPFFAFENMAKNNFLN